MWQRHRLLDALRERAEQAESERHLLAEREVAAERRRIAREIHDVVAHRVSVSAVQAGVLEAISDDDRVGRIAEVIRANSTAALPSCATCSGCCATMAWAPRAPPGPRRSSRTSAGPARPSTCAHPTRCRRRPSRWRGRPAGELPTSGFGLVGMRERVTVAGGSVTTGPTDAVRACFPR